MRKLLFTLLWLQLSHGCHKDLTRTTRRKAHKSRRIRGGRSNNNNKGVDYMSNCMDAKEMSNHCAFLSCHHGDSLLPGPMPCSPQFCQCQYQGRSPTPMTCAKGTVFNPFAKPKPNCDWPLHNSECRLMRPKPKPVSSPP